MRSLPGVCGFVLLSIWSAWIWSAWICSANRWLGVDTFSCETVRRFLSALFRIRQGALPETLLHVEQFGHFDSFLRFHAFSQQEPNREGATANQGSARAQSRERSGWLWVSHMKVT
jgi:hypothetical protein